MDINQSKTSQNKRKCIIEEVGHIEIMKQDDRLNFKCSVITLNGNGLALLLLKSTLRIGDLNSGAGLIIS